LINIAIAAVILLFNQAERPQSRLFLAGLVAIVVILVVKSSPGPAPFQDVKDLHSIVTDEYGELAYIEGPLATVSVVENSIGQRTIFVDNASVAGTDRILLTDQKSLAHVPLLLLENPRTALTVGFGSGGASWSFLLYEEMERVDCIEICPTVPRLAHTLRESNHGLLDGWDRKAPLPKTGLFDGRYRVIFDDARSFLRFSGQQYDVIATDCTDLRYKSNANLYDVEYFELCRKAITEDGMVVVWMPLGGMSSEVFASALRTFSHVFPDMSIWFMNNEPTHYLLLLGTKQPLRISLKTMKERLARPAIRADLEEIALQQPEKILSCFLTDAAAVEARLQTLNSQLNTEDMPLLEFQSPKFGIADEPLLDNLGILRRHQLPVQSLIDDLDAYPDSAALLEKLSIATPSILDGHAQLRRLDLRAAAKSYLAAQRACPEDASLATLLRFDDIRHRLSRNPNDIWPLVTLGEIELEKGNLALGSRIFLHIRSLTANSEDVLGVSVFDRATLGLAECLIRTGQLEGARQYLESQKKRLSKNPYYEELLAQTDSRSSDSE
jgi:spermidine synthase